MAIVDTLQGDRPGDSLASFPGSPLHTDENKEPGNEASDSLYSTYSSNGRFPVISSRRMGDVSPHEDHWVLEHCWPGTEGGGATEILSCFFV